MKPNKPIVFVWRGKAFRMTRPEALDSVRLVRLCRLISGAKRLELDCSPKATAAAAESMAFMADVHRYQRAVLSTFCAELACEPLSLEDQAAAIAFYLEKVSPASAKAAVRVLLN